MGSETRPLQTGCPPRRDGTPAGGLGVGTGGAARCEGGVGQAGQVRPAGPGVAVSDGAAVQARWPGRGAGRPGAHVGPRGVQRARLVGWGRGGWGQPRAPELLSRPLGPTSSKLPHSVAWLPTRPRRLPPPRTEPTLPARLPRPLPTQASPSLQGGGGGSGSSARDRHPPPLWSPGPAQKELSSHV